MNPWRQPVHAKITKAPMSTQSMMAIALHHDRVVSREG